MALRKTGEDTQNTIKLEITRSIRVYRLTAPAIPRGIAKKTANTALIRTSCMVVGSLAARRVATGCRCLKLSPRFPLAALPIQIRYCWGRLTSKWYWAIRDARVSSLILRPLVMEPIGSEGVRRIRKKINTDTARSIGTRKRRRFRKYRNIKFTIWPVNTIP
jgi:hypothetical protein